MDLQLRDRVVLVVGGTGLIGSAIAERARQEGATVRVASRSGAGGLAMDAASEESIAGAVAKVMEEF
ncbi:MAG: hypothetical protein QOD50_1027, partial [Actinomycetota bacterium]|nr:hypothetical protein [Actinomycetota bacterium]